MHCSSCMIIYSIVCVEWICDSAPLDRQWTQGNRASLRVNSYTHDCRANAVSPFICSIFTDMSMLAAVKIACLWVVCLCRCVEVCVFKTEVSDRVARIRAAQALKVHRGVKQCTEGESGTKIPKAGPKQRLNPFMWGLFSCCEWQMYVWTPPVSKCLFTGCKSAASKLKIWRWQHIAKSKRINLSQIVFILQSKLRLQSAS